MMKERILVVEDEPHISKLIRYNIEKAGYDNQAVITGEEALLKLEESKFDLVILDVMLPKMDGFEVCRRIRQHSRLSQLPVLMLTARGEETDKIVGFELGADDYLVKPFSPRELILRIKSILRRKQQKSETIEGIFEFDQLKLDTIKHKVFVGTKDIILTAMEFKLLKTLMHRRGRMQSRNQLLSDVWDMDSDVTTRTIDTHIKRLRQKLGKMGKLIETVRGYGYRFSD